MCSLIILIHRLTGENEIKKPIESDDTARDNDEFLIGPTNQITRIKRKMTKSPPKNISHTAAAAPREANGELCHIKLFKDHNEKHSFIQLSLSIQFRFSPKHAQYDVRRER